VFYWIYKLPSLLAIAVFGVTFVGIFFLGILVLRPVVRPWFHRQPGANAVLGDTLQYFGVIYGLLLGLLAVGTFENHTDAEKAVVSEASAISALYRDVSAYPEPYRHDLRALIRRYVRSTIDTAWPKQRHGILPVPGADEPNLAVDIYTRMTDFEPQTNGQQAIQENALRQYDTFVESRRTRLYSVISGMPRVMWYTVAIGALINMIFLWLFDLRLAHHLLIGGMISFFMATMICLIAILDNPFRGEVGVSPEAFELVYSQIIKD
jgi:hypothetical protein